MPSGLPGLRVEAVDLAWKRHIYALAPHGGRAEVAIDYGLCPQEPAGCAIESVKSAWQIQIETAIHGHRWRRTGGRKLLGPDRRSGAGVERLELSGRVHDIEDAGIVSSLYLRSERLLPENLPVRQVERGDLTGAIALV